MIASTAPTPSDINATAARLGCRPWRGPTEGEAFQAWADRVEWAAIADRRACRAIRDSGAAIVEADRQAGYGPSAEEQQAEARRNATAAVAP
jgi:hypothetical protein